MTKQKGLSHVIMNIFVNPQARGSHLACVNMGEVSPVLFHRLRLTLAWGLGLTLAWGLGLMLAWGLGLTLTWGLGLTLTWGLGLTLAWTVCLDSSVCSK